jgi:DNA-binding GntR family transcriptional regulator
MTAADAVTATLRQQIVTGHYEGGRRITEEAIAADLGASRTSVREALRVLNAEGFVDIRPYFGAFVAKLSAKAASDLLEVQGGLESLAAGLAATRRSNVDIAELRALIARGRAAAAEARTADSSALHGEFHRVLARATGNDSLTALLVQVRYKVDWVYATAVRRPPRDSWDEHAGIVDAIEAADSTAAAEAARTHARRGSQAQIAS